MALIRCGSGSNFKPIQAGYALTPTGTESALPYTSGSGLGEAFLIGTKGYSSVTITPSRSVVLNICGIAENGDITPIASGDSTGRTVDVTGYDELFVLTLNNNAHTTTISIS